MNPAANPPSGDKSVQRNFFLEKRKILMKNKNEKAGLDSEIQSRLVISPEYRACSAVFIYAARGHEIATSMIIHAALANGKTVAMPRCEDGGIMRFYRICSTADLALGRFGIAEPVDGCELCEPDESTLCVCPALACDMNGCRLGFGGGWYDRFLSGFKGTSAVLCYADAFIPALPREDHDIPVNMIVTERFIKRI